MGHEYALDWLDQMVNELDPRRTEPESLDDEQSIAIVEKATQEEKRLILMFKRFVFQERKHRQIKNTVNQYLAAAVSLMKTASNNLNQIPARADNFRLALGSVLSCLGEVSAFIVKRYKNLLDRDLSLDMLSIDTGAHDFRKLGNLGVMRDNPELSELVIGAFSDIFLSRRDGEITIGRLDYWVSVCNAVSVFDVSKATTELFDRLEVIMIERNFNSPLFVKYLTSKFSHMVDIPGDSSLAMQNLALLQKTFNQMPVMKDMIFSNHFDDLSLTINTWFIEEIDFRSKVIRPAVAELDDRSFKKARKYERKTSDKVICNLTVDQLSLFFKAADLSNIISARSLSAIFQSVAPYLSTPHRADISHSSLRVKSYTVEERDKTLLIEIMTRLTEQIKDL